ncbi:MAG: hypothetical protein NTX38_08955, partial [Methylobacter sp.]|nr:hypothetical protein [Methylobacter sp.]
AQVAALSSSQLNTLSSTQVQAIETGDIVALTTAQVAALSSTQLNTLSSTQLQAIETADIVALTTAQVAALSSTQLNTLNSTQLQAIETADIVALTTAQVSTLSSTQLNALTSSQIRAFETTDIAALTTTQVAHLGTTQIIALTTAQYAVLHTADVAALSGSVIFALSTSGLTELTLVDLATLASPIVLDLNGDGLSTLNYSSGVQFDIHASGQKVQTGWVSPTDGLLVLDRNGNGVIDSGSELFGTSTMLSNGQKAKDGYQALSELDSNGDHLITNADKGWDELKVWVDKNSDGITEAGEMVTLDSLGITQLNLAAKTTSVIDNGNVIGLTSNYQTVDGNNHGMADVWFVADKNLAATTATGLTQSLATQVTGLAQAIQEYTTATIPANPVLPSNLPTPGPATVSGNVGGLASVLNQFDANGNLLTNTLQSAAVQAVSGVDQVLVPNLDPSKTGFLAS